MASGCLLVQLGSPRSAEVADVRVFLQEFLSDPLVISPRPLFWNTLLRFCIAPRRAPCSAAIYRKMLTESNSERMPLVERTIAFADDIAARLTDVLPVQYCFQYGCQPDPAEALRHLAQQGCDDVLILPLYPQRAGATVEAACQRITAIQQSTPDLRSLRLRFHRNGFATEAFWIESQLESIRAALAGQAIPPTDLLFSMHGYPEARITAGDPYLDDCQASIALIKKELLQRKICPPETGFHVSYQSKFGRQRWLEPSSEQMLAELGRQQSSVLVVCPSFTVENLETLMEVDHDLRDVFFHHGGKAWQRVPCLDAAPFWCERFADFLRTYPF